MNQALYAHMNNKRKMKKKMFPKIHPDLKVSYQPHLEPRNMWNSWHTHEIKDKTWHKKKRWNNLNDFLKC
jgi:hypothetical protein